MPHRDRQYHGINGPEILKHQNLWYYRQSLEAETLSEQEEKYHRVFHKDSYAHNLVNEFWNYFRRNSVSLKFWESRATVAGHSDSVSESIDFTIIVNELADDLTEPEMRVLALVLNKTGLIQYLGHPAAVPAMQTILEEVLRDNILSGAGGAVFVRNKYQFDKALESLKRKILLRFPDLAERL